MVLEIKVSMSDHAKKKKKLHDSNRAQRGEKALKEGRSLKISTNSRIGETKQIV